MNLSGFLSTDKAPSFSYNTGMRVLYLDSLFWMELTADTVLLWASGKLCCVRRSIPRLAAAGLIGSAYTVFSLLFPPAASIAGKAVSLLLMLLAAYGGEKKLWRPALAYLLLCAVYGGVAEAVTLAAGKATVRALVFSAGISLGICAIPFRFSEARSGSSALRLVGEGGEVRMTALRDTGNRLVDPFSGKPVVIASEDSLMPLYSAEIRQALAASAGMPPEERLELLGKGFCLIPLRTVNGEGLELSGTVPMVYLDDHALGPCRVVFSRLPIRCGNCSALIGGDSI